MSCDGNSRGPRRIRALLADDSGVMRNLLRMVLEAQPWIEIAAVARNGREAVEEFERTRPNLVILDVEMPELNGLEALARIRRADRTVPIIMCSAYTQRGAQATIAALSQGATDYVAKPSGQSGVREGIIALEQQLIPKLAALFSEPAVSCSAQVTTPFPTARHGHSASGLDVVVIGVSTGGPAALEAILPRLPAQFPLPILIAQHMPLRFTEQLALRLNSICALTVREAEDGFRPQPGVVEIARGDWHLELRPGLRLHLDQKAPVNFCRPSVDILFRSAAEACNGRVLGVVLTGMGSDGVTGCESIRAAGGTVFAQDAASSVVWGMPGAVVHAGLACKVLPLHAIAGEIANSVSASMLKTA
jgi:two-component system chemotaxis response regulator CheB